MKLLRTGDGRESPRQIGLFGSGLLGSAIRRSIASRFSAEETLLPVAWSDREVRERDLTAVERAMERGPAFEGPLTLIWAGGKAGFGSSPEETGEELQGFQAVLSMAERLAKLGRERPIRFLLLSSAGGLFEGQRLVDSTSSPSPRRPYGELKLEQERRLAAASILQSTIVRLSSVYGRIRHGHRLGLISTLIANAIRRRASTIVGSMSTLRDFVFAEDVADFLVEDLLFRETAAPGLMTLASGRPVSIYEARRLIEGISRTRVFVTFARHGLNAEDITFSPSLHPAGWRPGDLRTNVAVLYNDAFEGYSAAAGAEPIWN